MRVRRKESGAGLDVDRPVLLALPLAARFLGAVARDPDLARLGLFALGDLDLEQPIAEPRLDVLAVHVVRERERADELAVGALDAVIVLSVLLLVLEAPLAADRQDAALELDLDLVLLESGKLAGQDELLLILMDVHRRDPRAEAHLLFAVAARGRRRSAEDPVEFAIRVESQVVHRFILPWVEILSSIRLMSNSLERFV